MLIATIVPNNYSMPFDCVKCWLQLPPKYSYYAVEGPSLPDNRNKVFEYARKLNDHLMFIDSDIIFRPDDVQKIEALLNSGFDAVTGVYVLGRPPYKPVIFKRTHRDFALIEPEIGIHQIGACGAGFLGINNRVIKHMPQNPFSNVWEGDTQHGEDVSFCFQLIEKGFKLYCDSSIKVGQLRVVHKYYDKV